MTPQSLFSAFSIICSLFTVELIYLQNSYLGTLQLRTSTSINQMKFLCLATTFEGCILSCYKMISNEKSHQFATYGLQPQSSEFTNSMRRKFFVFFWNDFILVSSSVCNFKEFFFLHFHYWLQSPFIRWYFQCLAN